MTGSAGHLGEALMRTLPLAGHRPVGLDLKDSPFTHESARSPTAVRARRACMAWTSVIHTATLHKPHVATHHRQDFIDTNVTGTLNLLEEAVSAGVGAFIFTSTTSVFGRALTPSSGAPAAWITEDVVPVPKNIYGVTKLAAENLCELFHRDRGLPCLILRTSRFFPEADDRKETREAYADANVKVNEFLYRRADHRRHCHAHLLALGARTAIGFGRYIVSATTPFTRDDLQELRHERASRRPTACSALRGRLSPPGAGRCSRQSTGSTSTNEHALELGWQPRFDFTSVIDRSVPDRISQRACAGDRFEGLPRRRLRRGSLPYLNWGRVEAGLQTRL